MDLSGILGYLAGFAITAIIFAIFTLGLNIHWGYTGLFNIGIAGFFALGAYTSALLTTAAPDPQLFEDYVFGGDLPNLMGALNLGIDLGSGKTTWPSPRWASPRVSGWYSSMRNGWPMAPKACIESPNTWGTWFLPRTTITCSWW
jgi:ABC-type branched-subunit amino acid transport system permease subunit